MSDNEPIQVNPITLEDELSSSFGRYAQYTILMRALPDVRDGLKPVQRRIIYAMGRSGNTPDKPYRKCAKTVGDVMGNFHPHGDKSIYDALVRMVQAWKLRIPLVDGHGNFGSMDDDPAAAMRYTESRLAKPAMALLNDIDHDTVPFRPTFDDSGSEPVVLPAAFPNLLVNGASGVSAGFATEIPPHNLGELVDALLGMIKNPEISLAEVRRHVIGPDFPTGGIVMGEEGLVSAYERGQGRIYVRARAEVGETTKKKPQIIINEIPYGVVKSVLVAQMEQLRLDGHVRGVSDVRDESDRDGLRIVIELERSADADGVLNFFYRKTNLQVSYNFNMIAIADRRPLRLGLLELLRHFLAHRREVVLRRSQFSLERAEKRLHEVEGLIRAIDILDEIIALIRASSNKQNARDNLMEHFGFSEVQAEAILVLRLHRLTNLEIKELTEEAAVLHQLINQLRDILLNESTLQNVISAELRSAKRAFGTPRRSEIVGTAPELTVALEVTVPAQRVVVALTAEGYIKRCHPRSEQEPTKLGLRPGDYLRFWMASNTTHRLLLFSNLGRCFNLKAHEIPEAKWAVTGVALINMVPIEKNERIVAALSVEEMETDGNLLLVTQRGMIKRTQLSDFATNRTAGVVALKLNEGDQLLRVLDARDLQELLLMTRMGQAIRFAMEECRVMGRSAAGVLGMRMSVGDRVVSAIGLGPNAEGHVALFTASGKAKQTILSEYEVQHRAGKGQRSIHRLKSGSHHVIDALFLTETAQLLLQTPSNQPSLLLSSDIPKSARDGRPYTVFVPHGGDSVVAVLHDLRYDPTLRDDGDDEPQPDDDNDGDLATSKLDPALV